MNQSEIAADQVWKRRVVWLARHGGATMEEAGEEVGLGLDRARSLFRAMEYRLAQALRLRGGFFSTLRMIEPDVRQGLIIGELYPFKGETREQAKKRLAAIVRQSYLALSPGECDDCEEKSAPHRVTCPQCTLKVCPYCWSHAHVFAVDQKQPEAVDKVEQEWDDAQALWERQQHWETEERLGALK